MIAFLHSPEIVFSLFFLLFFCLWSRLNIRFFRYIWSLVRLSRFNLDNLWMAISNLICRDWFLLLLWCLYALHSILILIFNLIFPFSCKFLKEVSLPIFICFWFYHSVLWLPHLDTSLISINLKDSNYSISKTNTFLYCLRASLVLPCS